MSRTTFPQRKPWLLYATCVMALCLSCSKKDKDDDDEDEDVAPPAAGPGAETQTSGGKVDVAVVPVGGAAQGLWLADAFGQAKTADLTSLKYYVQEIKICESVAVNGTGFSNPVNCLVVYAGDITPNYDTFGYAAAKANTAGYVDLMDATDVKRLSSSIQLTSGNVGKYNYGFVNWYKPIKVKVSVPLNDVADTILYTKDVEPLEMISGGDNYKTMANRISNITTGPAEEAVVIHNNGGAWFKFAQPFEVTAQDIADKVDFKLKLTFNPDGIVNGQTGSGNQIVGTAGAFDEAATEKFSIDVPMLALTPVVHKATDTVMRETYKMAFSDGTDAFNVRVELYYLDSDATKAIYGASVAGLLTDASIGKVPPMHQVFTTTETDADGVLLKDYEDHPFFRDFHRLDAVGAAPAPAKIVFGGGTCLTKHGDTCHTDKAFATAESVTYELVSVEEVK